MDNSKAFLDAMENSIIINKMDDIPSNFGLEIMK
jgi:hypothetical protein